MEKKADLPWLLIAGLALLVLGGAMTLYVVMQAFTVLEPHAPSGSFTIFGVPEGGNPQKLWDSYRIFFLHLPSALSAMTASLFMGAGGLLYLISRHPRWDALTVAGAEMGIASCFITMATGYFWGEFAWGNGWTWEPRLTSALVLWLSYIALVLLRQGVDNPEKRRTYTAAYGLLTLPLYFLVKKSIEIFGNISHPASLGDLMGEDNAVSQLLSMARPSVVLVFIALVVLRYWQRRVEYRSNQLEELIDDQRAI